LQSRKYGRNKNRNIVGNLIPNLLTFPSPRWVFIPTMLRFLFLPYFLLCNYRPTGVERLWPAMIHWDYAFWMGNALFGLTGGYVSSLAIIYCPRTVEPEYASIAGMFGGASIVTGIFAGIGFSYLMPVIVSHPALSFDAPNWWPSYHN
jgi:equilibrative nucleoside transporter 1/2/3